MGRDMRVYRLMDRAVGLYMGTKTQEWEEQQGEQGQGQVQGQGQQGYF